MSSVADATQIPGVIDLRAVGNSRSLPCPFPYSPTPRAKPFEDLQGKLPFLSFTHILLIATITFKAGQGTELWPQINFSFFFFPGLCPLLLLQKEIQCVPRGAGDVKWLLSASPGWRDKSRDKLWVPGAPSSSFPLFSRLRNSSSFPSHRKILTLKIFFQYF